MPFFLSLLIKDISTDKCCYFKLLHTKITDALPSFYHLLSNMIDLLEKRLCLIIYYTYGFEKISKPSMIFFSTKSWAFKIKEKNQKDTLPTDTLPDIFFKIDFWKFKLFHTTFCNFLPPKELYLVGNSI
jgi:hypothetical protein